MACEVGEVEMASSSFKEFCCSEEQKNGIVVVGECGIGDVWFWLYCSKNKRYCSVFL